MIVAIIIVVVIIIRSTLTGALQKKRIFNLFMFKILINHAQLLSLTSSFSLKWSSIVEDILSTSRPVAEVSTQILSFD